MVRFSRANLNCSCMDVVGSRLLKNVYVAELARQKLARKRSLYLYMSRAGPVSAANALGLLSRFLTPPEQVN
jgi:hypothetical protein